MGPIIKSPASSHPTGRPWPRVFLSCKMRASGSAGIHEAMSAFLTMVLQWWRWPASVHRQRSSLFL